MQTRPVLAICRHAVHDDAAAVSLASEAEGAVGVEITVQPLEPSAATVSAGAIRDLSGGVVAVRYHFPLGSHEISHVDNERADEALVSMIATVNAIAAAGGDSLTVHAPLPSDARGSLRLAETQARLRELVAHGRATGVAICLENLRWGLTSEPDAFVSLTEAAESRVTFDVGHGVSSTAAATGLSADSFVRELGTLVDTAHVYGHETDRHHPPTQIEEIAPVLDALSEVGCAWWTIELLDLEEIRATRALLSSHLV